MLRLYISDNVSGITKAQVNCEKAEGYDDKYSSQSFEFDQQNIKIDEQTGSKYVDIRIEADFAGKIDLFCMIRPEMFLTRSPQISKAMSFLP